MVAGSGGKYSALMMVPLFPYAFTGVVYAATYSIARNRSCVTRAALVTSLLMLLVTVAGYGSIGSSSTGVLLFVFLPCYLTFGGPLVFYIAFFLFRVWAGVTRSRQDGLARCSACGYPLFGLTTPRCPECGEPFDRSVLTGGGRAAPDGVTTTDT
jgi:hypothetical protein